MPCDLLRLYGDLASALPAVGDEAFLFTREVLAVPPPVLTTDRMVLRGYQVPTSNHYLSDTVELLGSPTMLRMFAVLIVAVVLHPTPGEVELQFPHPASNVKRVRLRLPHFSPDGEPLSPTGGQEDYWAEPSFFRYQVDGAPVPNGDWQRRPLLKLTNEQEVAGTGTEWMARRDTAVGFGSDQAMIFIAQHILDAAVSDNNGTVDLWGDGPTGALAPHSARLRLAFPDYPPFQDLDPALPANAS
jgi:hypothetical protein